jgi:hypothetical protein
MDDTEAIGPPGDQADDRTTLIVRGFLFLSSYAPLFVILAIRFQRAALRGTCVGLAVIGFGYLAVVLWIVPRGARTVPGCRYRDAVHVPRDSRAHGRPHPPSVRRIGFVRQTDPHRVARAGGLTALFGQEGLRRLEDPAFVFEAGFDLVISPDEVAVLRLEAFNRMFADLNTLALAAPANASKIAGMVGQVVPAAVEALARAAAARRSSRSPGLSPPRVCAGRSAVPRCAAAFAGNVQRSLRNESYFSGMDEFRARRVVDSLRDRGVNAHLLRGAGQFGVRVPLPGGREAEWDTDGLSGL